MNKSKQNKTKRNKTDDEYNNRERVPNIKKRNTRKNKLRRSLLFVLLFVVNLIRLTYIFKWARSLARSLAQFVCLFSVQDLSHSVESAAGLEPLDLALVHRVLQLDLVHRSIGVLHVALDRLFYHHEQNNNTLCLYLPFSIKNNS